MQLIKAIELQASFTQAPRWMLDPDLKDAINLGIEAMKRELEYRESMPPLSGELLPGETPPNTTPE